MEEFKVIKWADDEDDNLNDKEKDNSPSLLGRLFESKPKVEDRGILDLLNITLEEATENVRIFDSVEGPESSLYLLHYLKDPPTSICAQEIRGMIIEKTEIPPQYKVVCRSFPYTSEALPDQIRIPPSFFDPDQMTILKAYEGTLFRVWWYDPLNKWFLSTHRKINSQNSRWGGPPFGEMFFDIFPSENLDLLLDKRLCYVFLMSTPENRFALPYSKVEKCLYHVATFDSRTNKLHLGGSLEGTRLDFPTIKYPEKIACENWEELRNKIDQMEWFDIGVIINISNKAPFKVLNPEYILKRQLRGNEPNLRIRWFQCEQEGTEKRLEELLNDQKEFWAQLKADNERIIDYLLFVFNEKYEKRNPAFYRLPKEVFWILQAFLEKKATSDGQDPKEVLRACIKAYNPRVRNALIREMYHSEKKTKISSRNTGLTYAPFFKFNLAK